MQPFLDYANTINDRSTMSLKLSPNVLILKVQIARCLAEDILTKPAMYHLKLDFLEKEYNCNLYTLNTDLWVNHIC